MDAMYRQLLTFLLVSGTGVGAQFTLEPQKVSALQYSNVSFIATVPPDWTIITWNLDTVLVLTIGRSNVINSNNTLYKARNLTTNSLAGVWEFSIIGVQREMQGNVICTVQAQPGPKTAELEVQVQGTVEILSGNRTVNEDEEVEFRAEMLNWNPAPEVSWMVDGVAAGQSLYNTSFQGQGLLTNGISTLRMQAVRSAMVQCRAFLSRATEINTVSLTVVPKPTDWTILIAVVVSFSSFALLVLLIILIVFCCNRKKEKENLLRQGRMQAGAEAARPRRGTINLGFAMDERPGVPQGAESGLNQRNVSPIYQIPHVESQARTRVNDPVEHGLDHRKHRHLTIV